MLEKEFQKRVLDVKSINLKIGLAIYIMFWGHDLSFNFKGVGGGADFGKYLMIYVSQSVSKLF